MRMSYVTIDRFCQEEADAKEDVRRELEPVRPAVRPAPPPEATVRTVKVGRNAPCPCGSGKKFKKCCGSPLR